MEKQFLEETKRGVFLEHVTGTILQELAHSPYVAPGCKKIELATDGSLAEIFFRPQRESWAAPQEFPFERFSLSEVDTPNGGKAVLLESRNGTFNISSSIEERRKIIERLLYIFVHKSTPSS